MDAGFFALGQERKLVSGMAATKAKVPARNEMRYNFEKPDPVQAVKKHYESQSNIVWSALANFVRRYGRVALIKIGRLANVEWALLPVL